VTTAIDWSEDAFFDAPERGSIDGGTTSVGPLWHSASPRWGHSMHTMCSYHGMFPAKMAHYFIQRYSAPGDVVLDPFSGRGTVALQARVEGRRVIANDLNPLAYVLSRAKAAPPTWTAAMDAVANLEKQYRRATVSEPDASDDIKMLYHPNTLRQLIFIRGYLLKRDLVAWTPEQLMIGGALAGIMHGAHRRDGSSQYLSISMPNTFSMSPTYVAKFIKENGLVAPDQDVFGRIRDKLARLYLDEMRGPDGESHAADAAELLTKGAIKPRSVNLVVTSPPYLQVVNYATANWIRLWLLGVDEVGREAGAGRKSMNAALDHRHTYATYRQFLLRMLSGLETVLTKSGVAAVVIGDVADPGKEAVPLARKIWDDVGADTGLKLLDLIEDDLPVDKKVSRIWGDTKGQATDRDCVLVLTPNGSSAVSGASTVEWDEPYKDGGPDAAHDRLKKTMTAG
jgi:hypothetical protein